MRCSAGQFVGTTTGGAGKETGSAHEACETRQFDSPNCRSSFLFERRLGRYLIPKQVKRQHCVADMVDFYFL